MPLADLRPDSWEFPLLLHVLGAMTLLGALLTAGIALLTAWRRAESNDALTLHRVGFRSLVYAALPAWLLMRVAGEWTRSRENVSDEAGWLGIGYVTADVGFLFLLAATALAGLSTRRAGGRCIPARIAAVLASLLVGAYLVAAWAMTIKSG